MWNVCILGDLRVDVDGAVVTVTGVRAKTLAFIALSGPSGITPVDLGKALGASGRIPEPATLQRRLSDLRAQTGLPIPDVRDPRTAGRYVLEPFDSGTVDAWEFVTGVEAVGAAADSTDVDALLDLWRGDPIAGVTATAALRWWQPVLEAQRRLVDVIEAMDPQRRSRLAHLHHYASLFPQDTVLQRLAGGPSGKPLLLVVEDQVMDEIVMLLEDEFDILPAQSYEEWCAVRDDGSLRDVRAALVDRHLDVSKLNDSRGTTKVARYLQAHTDIPVTLMSVDVDCSANKQLELCLKYRLMDVIRKHENGTLNEAGLIEAARAMTDRSPKAHRLKMERWVASVVYQVEDDQLFGRGTSRDLVQRCHDHRDRIQRLLTRGELDQAEVEVARFMAAFARPNAAATP